MLVAVMALVWAGILLQISSPVAARIPKKDCGKYFQNEFYCNFQCRPPGKCEDITYNGNTTCSYCEEAKKIDIEQCDGIHFTGPCQEYFGFVEENDADVLCKDNMYYIRDYYEPISGIYKIFRCYHCTKGLHCDE